MAQFNLLKYLFDKTPTNQPTSDHMSRRRGSDDIGEMASIHGLFFGQPPPGAMIDDPHFDFTDPSTSYRNGTLFKKDVMRWNVDSSILRRGENPLRSDVFVFGSHNSRFYLAAWPADAPCFTVSLVRMKESDSKVDDNIKVSISLLDTRERCHHTCERILKPDQTSVSATFDTAFFHTHHLVFLKGLSLTIQCSLDIDQLIKESQGATSKILTEYPEESTDELSDDLRSLLTSGQRSDLLLIAGGKEFKAHKAILCARSPVFEAMFAHDTLERNNNQVSIEDISGDAMYQLLHYLYTGKLEDISAELVLSLFVAADKYSIVKLKQMCSVNLGTKLNSRIALSVLVLANLHRDENLKQAAINTVLNNAIEIMKSDEWITFLREYSEIANSIILSLALKSVTI